MRMCCFWRVDQIASPTIRKLALAEIHDLPGSAVPVHGRIAIEDREHLPKVRPYLHVGACRVKDSY